jgi:hypothetical protein
MQNLHHIVEPAPTRPERKADSAPLILDADTIAALKDLGNAFAAVRRRLISEGYVIQEGRYVAPSKDH